MRRTEPIRIPVPSEHRPFATEYRRGYAAGVWMEGGFRTNLSAMRYERDEPLTGDALGAWNAGFLDGFLARRRNPEPTPDRS